MRAVHLLPDEVEILPRGGQRTPEVVGDDPGEPVEARVPPFEFQFGTLPVRDVDGGADHLGPIPRLVVDRKDAGLHPPHLAVRADDAVLDLDGLPRGQALVPILHGGQDPFAIVGMGALDHHGGIRQDVRDRPPPDVLEPGTHVVEPGLVPGPDGDVVEVGDELAEVASLDQPVRRAASHSCRLEIQIR